MQLSIGGMLLMSMGCNTDNTVGAIKDPELGSPGSLLVHAVRNGEEDFIEFALEPYTIFTDELDVEDRTVVGQGATGTTVGDLPKSGRLLVDLGIASVPRTEDGHPMVEIQGGLYSHAEAIAVMDEDGEEIYVRLNQLVGEAQYDCTVLAHNLKPDVAPSSRDPNELRGALLYSEPLDRQWIGMRSGQYVYPEATPTFNGVLIPNEQLMVSGTKLQAVGGPDGLSPILVYQLEQDFDFSFSYYRVEEAHLYDVTCTVVD